MPRSLLKDLRTELDLTQNSIRVYKKEAIKEVDNYLKNYDSKIKNILLNNITEWLSSTGFLFPRTKLNWKDLKNFSAMMISA